MGAHCGGSPKRPVITLSFPVIIDIQTQQRPFLEPRNVLWPHAINKIDSAGKLLSFSGRISGNYRGRGDHTEKALFDASHNWYISGVIQTNYKWFTDACRATSNFCRAGGSRKGHAHRNWRRTKKHTKRRGQQEGRVFGARGENAGRADPQRLLWKRIWFME